MTALDLLWQAALVEQATESYFSIRVADRASAERRRAIDEFLARDVVPDGIVPFTRGTAAAYGPRPPSRSTQTTHIGHGGFHG